MAHSFSLASLLSSGRPLSNGWISIGHSFIAESMASQGFDLITIDMQHGVVSYDNVVTMVSSVQGAGVPLMVRVPWLEPGIIMKVLDLGVDGIICPMVNSVSDAENLVKFTRYPPLGERSYGPIRSNMRFGGDYGSKANDNVIVLAMIETRRAFDSHEEILGMNGIDGAYVGPSDFALDHGLGYGQDRQEDVLLEKMRKLTEFTRSRGKFAGIHSVSAKYCTFAQQDLGFSFATLASDAGCISKAAQMMLGEFNQLTDHTGKAGAVSGY